MPRLLVRLAVLCLSAGIATSQNVEVHAPSQPPSSASDVVDRQFLGLMVESTSWPDYADQELSRNLIGNIITKTGAPVIMRVGGTSGDNFIYDASQDTAFIRDNTSDHSLKANITVGKAFMDSFTRTTDVRYVLQVPLARNQLDKTVAFTKAAVEKIGKENLEAIEIGNEPDLYGCKEGPPNCKRLNPWTVSTWTQEFLKYADAISRNVDLPSGPIYQAGSFAGEKGWNPEAAYNAGLNKSDKIKAFAMHHYQSHVGRSLRDELLNHNVTVSRLERFKSSLAYMHTKHSSVPFLLGEVGDALGSLDTPGDNHEKQLDAVLGSALWEVDWLLYAMASSFDRVNMNQCKRCNFASWWTAQSAGVPAVIRAQYFGLALAADFLGGLDARFGSLPLRVASLYHPTDPYLSPYAGYLDGRLDRYAVVELTEWNVTSTAARPVRTVALDVPADVTSAELRRLTGNGTDADASTMAYAGVRYTVANPSGETVGPATEKLPIQGGKVSFKLRASEAALVTLKRK